ncbi:MAG: TIGR03621 family F420-dependent LLM class oxidoreductase [Thermomicrobiales bacterium]
MTTTPRPFRFGVIATRANSGAEWVGSARRAEALGFSTFVMPDGVAYGLSPFPALAAVEAATTTLRLGTYVLANDFRNPVFVAKEAATVDFLSGGRFELGIGAGRPDAVHDNRMLGLLFDRGGVRLARLAESLAIIKALLAGERATATGPYYAVHEATAAPRPIQQPRPPLMVAGSGRRMLELAAREADIVALGFPPDTTEASAAAKIGWMRAAAGARFDQVELNLNLIAVDGQVPRLVRRTLGRGSARPRRRGHRRLWYAGRDGRPTARSPRLAGHLLRHGLGPVDGDAGSGHRAPRRPLILVVPRPLPVLLGGHHAPCRQQRGQLLRAGWRRCRIAPERDACDPAMTDGGGYVAISLKEKTLPVPENCRSTVPVGSERLAVTCASRVVARTCTVEVSPRG